MTSHDRIPKSSGDGNYRRTAHSIDFARSFGAPAARFGSKTTLACSGSVCTALSAPSFVSCLLLLGNCKLWSFLPPILSSTQSRTKTRNRVGFRLNCVEHPGQETAILMTKRGSTMNKRDQRPQEVCETHTSETATGWAFIRNK